MYLVTLDVIGNTFPANNDESYLRRRKDIIWHHYCVGGMTQLAKLTKNSDDIYPRTGFDRTFDQTEKLGYTK